VDAVTIRRWELGLFSPSSNRIGRVAEAYGVEVSELMGAADMDDGDESSSVLPIKGYVEAGATPAPQSDDLGTISLPTPMVQGGPSAYFLVVSGDSLVPDGVHDGDVLLVCPEQPPRVGGLCVIEKDDSLYAGTYITPGSLRVRTNTGTTVDMDLTPDQLIGAVGWHVRKM
jgi:SOS-response transcriptional repressor LexA